MAQQRKKKMIVRLPNRIVVTANNTRVHSSNIQIPQQNQFSVLRSKTHIRKLERYFSICTYIGIKEKLLLIQCLPDRMEPLAAF